MRRLFIFLLAALLCPSCKISEPAHLEDSPLPYNPLEWWSFAGLLHSKGDRTFACTFILLHIGDSAYYHSDRFFLNATVADSAQGEKHLLSAGRNYQAGQLKPGHAFRLPLRQEGSRAAFRSDKKQFRLKIKQEALVLNLRIPKNRLRVAAPFATDTLYGMEARFIPDLAASGKLRSGGKKRRVSGLFIHDRFWNGSAIMQRQSPLRWLKLNVWLPETGEFLHMLKVTDTSTGREKIFAFMARGREAHELPPQSFTLTETAHWESSASGKAYPVAFDISVTRDELPPGKAGLHLLVTALRPDQEASLGIKPYYQGVGSLTGAKGMAHIECIPPM